jgi:hypothetical protein
MAVDSWNTNEALNAVIEGEPTAESTTTFPAINNLFRKICAAIKVFRNNAYCKDKNVTIQATGGSAPASPAENDLWIEYTP